MKRKRCQRHRFRFPSQVQQGQPSPLQHGQLQPSLIEPSPVDVFNPYPELGVAATVYWWCSFNPVGFRGGVREEIRHQCHCRRARRRGGLHRSEPWTRGCARGRKCGNCRQPVITGCAREHHAKSGDGPDRKSVHELAGACGFGTRSAVRRARRTHMERAKHDQKRKRLLRKLGRFLFR